MAELVRVVRGTCKQHGQSLVHSLSGIRPLCPDCYGVRKPLEDLVPYGPADWYAARSVTELRECDRAMRREWSKRRHKLAYCALARMYFSRSREYWLWQAVEAAEQWADAGAPPDGANDIFLRLGGSSDETRKPGEWVWLAVECVSGAYEEQRDDLDWYGGTYTFRHPEPEFSICPDVEAVLQPAPAVVYRDLVPNPFLPLVWKPDWFTTTVLDLARTIYDTREFTAMPILADALQDAGCDDEQILTHCRANKPHARGCWVLDAILGKS